MAEKICAKCGALKSVSEFGVHARDGYRSRCKSCTKEDRKTKVESRGTIEGRNLCRRRNYERHSDERKLAAKRWRQKNPVRAKESRRKWWQRQSRELTDAYIRYRLAERSPINMADFPQQLVDLYREQLRLKRLLKDMNYEKR